MGELTIDDLAADDGASTDDGGGSGGDTADWVGDLIDRLDEKGVLDALVAQQVGLDPSEAVAPEPDAGGADAAADAGGADLDAATVATFGKLVIDNVGDVPVSEVVKYAESNPETVERMIDAATGGADDR